MIKVTELAFTSRAVTDIDSARAFYEGILGLEAGTVQEFENNHWWIEYELPGGTLALSNAWPPSGRGMSTLVAFEVADFDAALAMIRKNNIPVAYGPIETPMCRMVGITDPDGNGVTIHKRKTE